VQCAYSLGATWESAVFFRNLDLGFACPIPQSGGRLGTLGPRGLLVPEWRQLQLAKRDKEHVAPGRARFSAA
jgi:hypothetical protein